MTTYTAPSRLASASFAWGFGVRGWELGSTAVAILVLSDPCPTLGPRPPAVCYRRRGRPRSPGIGSGVGGRRLLRTGSVNDFFEQEGRDSTPQPVVLETPALPVELRPSERAGGGNPPPVVLF